MTAAPTDLPSSALAVSRAAVEHDLIARIARGQNLLRRAVHGRPDVITLARELAEWSGHNRELLAKRFADHRLADAYSSAAEPFIVPAHDIAVRAQTDLLRQQLQHQIEWLEMLRSTVPLREEPPADRRDPRRTPRGATARTPTVLASSASRLAVRVVGAVARATGMLPTVIEGGGPDDESLLRAAEMLLPLDAITIVVVEPANPESLVALGYAVGALGMQDVIAVCAPDACDGLDLAPVVTIPIDGHDQWRFELGRHLEQAGFREAEVAVTRA